IINYNIYADSFDYSYCKNTLLGTQYAPLREEFAAAYQTGFRVNISVKNVFISTGGSDPQNIGVHILTEFAKHEYFKSLTFHIVVGSLNEHKEEIARLSKQYHNIKLCTNITAMAALMQSCDIAISAAGSTLYELCACGLPTVNYFFADNQKLIAENFANQGIMLCAGDLRSDVSVGCKIIVSNCESIFDYHIRIKMSEMMSIVTDGKGAKRIAVGIKELINEE
ncbi:MAG: glycosyltransferase, partial [Oscillospiraceae bacterium]